jgi:integrase
MSLVTNVFRRGATYYFRIRVPAHLRAKVGRNELWKSLRTSLAGEARRRCVWVQTLTETLWRDFERAMDLSECKVLIDRWLAAEIKEDAYLRGMPDGERYVAVVMRREPSWKPDTLVEVYDHEQLARYRKLTPEQQRAEIGPDHYVREDVFDRQLTVDGQRKVFAEGEARLSARDDEIAVQHVREMFAREKVEVSEFSDLFEAATKMMIRAQGDLARVIRERDASAWEEWVTDDPASDLLSRLPAMTEARTATGVRSKVPVAEKVVRAGLRLSEAAERAIPELAMTEKVKVKRVQDYRVAVATFIDWWGSDPDVGEMTPKRCGDFAVALTHYPSNAHKRAAYRNLPTFQEKLAAAQANGEQSVLNPVTVNGKYLTPLRRIFGWHLDKGMDLVNPFARVVVRKPKRSNPRTKRRDFTPGEVIRFFALPLFTGAEGASGLQLYKPGTVKVSDWRMWVPLICMFTGMRLNEACGLAVADIKEEDGIAYFHVRDEVEGQSTKSDAARRKVPLHHEVIDAGFLEFVAEMRSQGRERLFEELEGGEGRYFSHIPSKFLNRLLRRIEEEDPDDPGKLTWHSSRHTVSTRLRAGGVRQDVSEELVGHEEGSTHAGYGNYDIQTLKRDIETIFYKGLDLSAIRRETSMS